MDHTRDYYALLGLSSEASQQDIKSTYRILARRLHPDVNHSPGANTQFQDVTTAYEILSDVGRRQHYDNMRQRLAKDPAYLLTNVLLSKRVLPILSEPQILYVLLEISANSAFQTQDARSNTPMNLVIVLDRSKSMRGPRLDRVKVAAHQIIEQLSNQDYLSIITFSDRAEVLIESQAVEDKNALKSIVSTMNADGGTEIYQGLSTALRQARQHLSTEYVNHIILLTDGQTYDDENLSLALADDAASLGIGISTMGIGEEWNDEFMDELASKTGGAADYINSPGAVVRFLNDRVRSLGAAYAERLRLTIAPDADVKLETVFKLMPHPHPISIAEQPIMLGALENKRPIRLLLQLVMPNNMAPGFRSFVRMDLTSDILAHRRYDYKVISDLSVEVADNPQITDPPRGIIDALGKLTLYRMQQKAASAIQNGHFDEATRRLENLATRLLASGHAELAQTAMMEAQRVKQTRALSAEGQKTMKFGTRMLMMSDGNNEEPGT